MKRKLAIAIVAIGCLALALLALSAIAVVAVGIWHNYPQSMFYVTLAVLGIGLFGSFIWAVEYLCKHRSDK